MLNLNDTFITNIDENDRKERGLFNTSCLYCCLEYSVKQMKRNERTKKQIYTFITTPTSARKQETLRQNNIYTNPDKQIRIITRGPMVL